MLQFPLIIIIIIIFLSFFLYKEVTLF